MHNPKRKPISSAISFVKPSTIHNFIHRFCGKLWKSLKDKHLARILYTIYYFILRGTTVA
ncbi:hypothetical protein DJ533_07215 [Acinetobacter defluvii]|uniref:Uncharacterized protein n=1 Tax=Acinetobacter defluvii TaxID=1871111 RepID=A0A2S2FHU0_9GAMM|nr:hypothetical protein DJ533_07215 [Acinetobacter defluvii]